MRRSHSDPALKFCSSHLSQFTSVSLYRLFSVRMYRSSPGARRSAVPGLCLPLPSAGTPVPTLSVNSWTVLLAADIVVCVKRKAPFSHCAQCADCSGNKGQQSPPLWHGTPVYHRKKGPIESRAPQKRAGLLFPGKPKAPPPGSSPSSFMGRRPPPKTLKGWTKWGVTNPHCGVMSLCLRWAVLFTEFTCTEQCCWLV